MSLRKFNLNRENDDIFETPEVEVEPQDVLDQIQTEEDEVELTEGVAEVEDDMDNADEAEEVIEELEEKIEEAKEVIAKAEEAAGVKEGEAPAEGAAEPEVAVADVVAVQESLKYLYKQAGMVPEREGVLSRESALESPYQAMKMNLEEAEGLLGKTKEVLGKIWEKIAAGFKWIIDKIKSLWPSRKNKLLKLQRALPPSWDLTPEQVKEFNEAMKNKSDTDAYFDGDFANADKYYKDAEEYIDLYNKTFKKMIGNIKASADTYDWKNYEKEKVPLMTKINNFSNSVKVKVKDILGLSDIKPAPANFMKINSRDVKIAMTRCMNFNERKTSLVEGIQKDMADLAKFLKNADISKENKPGYKEAMADLKAQSKAVIKIYDLFNNTAYKFLVSAATFIIKAQKSQSQETKKANKEAEKKAKENS